MLPQRSFPLVPDQSYVAQGDGRFNLTQTVPPGDARFPRGPRFNKTQGTIDLWALMGSGADSLVIASVTTDSTSTPLVTIGVNASGQCTGDIDDVDGTTRAAWAATSMGTVAEGGQLHVQVAWNATTPINGLRHVKVVVNGVTMGDGDFTTDPLAAWSPFQPFYVTTGKFASNGFDGSMFLTQVSSRVVI